MWVQTATLYAQNPPESARGGQSQPCGAERRRHVSGIFLLLELSNAHQFDMAHILRTLLNLFNF
jgi:hypothetical protein